MRHSISVYPMIFVGAGACISGCGSDRSAAKLAAPSPSSSATVLDGGASVDAATDAGTIAPVVAAGPIEGAPLVRASLVRFGSTGKACAGLLAHSASPVLRNELGGTFTSVRTGCRLRPANPMARVDGHRAPREPSLVEFFRTTSFPRHSDVDTVAAALAFPIGNTEWLVAIEGVEESEGMQSMPLGDASGSVEVASVEHVALAGTEVPGLVFVLSVTVNPNKRRDLVVCDSGGAWCTNPSTLDRIFSGRDHEREAPGGASRANEARSYTFRRHPRGVLVVTVDEPPVPDRLFPFAATP